jgi:hypothetical protein
MDAPNVRETCAQRVVRTTLERIVMRLDEIEDDASPSDLRDLKSDANDALIRLMADQEPHVRVIRAEDVEKIEGDGRGGLLFLKGADGGVGPVWVVAPAVIALMQDVVARSRG